MHDSATVPAQQLDLNSRVALTALAGERARDSCVFVKALGAHTKHMKGGTDRQHADESGAKQHTYRTESTARQVACVAAQSAIGCSNQVTRSVQHSSKSDITESSPLNDVVLPTVVCHGHVVASTPVRCSQHTLAV